MPSPRSLGEFLTPPIYAVAAHDHLLRALRSSPSGISPDETYNWWDPFAGTGRLQEPFPATMSGRVFASTLAEEDLDTLGTLELPAHAHIFRYDFLNEPVEQLPDQLRDKLTPRRRWVFILNPPFVGHRARRGERGETDLDTAVRAAMLPRRLGRASLNLTTQALFRLLELVTEHDLDATVGVFSQASVWTGEGYSAFRELWQSEFGFDNGFVFPAREFHGVTGEWPASFTVWRKGRPSRPMVLDVMERGEIIGRKELRQPERPLGKWVPRPKNDIPAPQMTSALAVATGKRTRREKVAKGALGYVSWLGNDVRNSKGTCLLSTVGATAGWSITHENWEQSLVAAATRMLVKPNWLNDSDQFSAPNMSPPHYQQFVADAVVWLIGSVHNQTVSLGSVEYRGETFDIPNQFFWMSPEELLKITDLPEEVRAGCENAAPPALVCWLRSTSFSPDAQWTLDELKRIVAVTAAARPLAPPHLQLLRWDAGWWQIRKGLCWPSEVYVPPPTILRRYRSFRRRHKKLGERLEKLVYDLGFLSPPLVPRVP